MKYEIAPIWCRPWLLHGLSEKLIESHYENNYGGAVRKLNLITAKLEAADFEKMLAPELNGLKREQLLALNSTLLHEIYFACLGGEGGKPAKVFADAITESFGSYERWKSEFVAMAKALSGGSGWVLMSYVPRDKRLINQYASEHPQAIVTGMPVLALDMYEHAYHIDFGANAAAYIDTWFRNIDWAVVQGRYQDAAQTLPPRPLEQPEFPIPGIRVDEVKAMLDAGEIQVIDTRPRHFVSRQQEIVDGVKWRDPERVQEWASELSKEQPVAVYCAYGFHIGCKTAIALRDAGFDARFVQGGHSAFKALGAKTRKHDGSD
jgi:Fe-Mn family superoxide dismutase